MFRFSLLIALLLSVGATVTARAQQRFPGVGRAATPAEVRAWDIDVRADLTGLPKGSGSVATGQDVWDAKCASCHGTFGESNETFPPIVGGTRKADVEPGRVRALVAGDVQRSTIMKLSQISTLWDYINRAMPWNNPKSLSVEEVYAVTAYILNLAELVPDDYVLSDQNMADAQRRLPNRNGMTTRHGLWDTRGKPDIVGTVCMRDCAVDVRVVSQLPDHARDAHGNLAEQHRPIGAVRGQVTTRAAVAAALGTDGAGSPLAAVDPRAIVQRNACSACHGVDNRIVGPTFREIASKYRDDANAADRLATNIKHGGVGSWGAVPMPAQGQVTDADIKTVVQWILAGAK